MGISVLKKIHINRLKMTGTGIIIDEAVSEALPQEATLELNPEQQEDTWPGQAFGSVAL